jgi:cytochrome b561
MQERYTATARWLHWLTVVLMVMQAVFGIWIAEFAPKDDKLKFLLYDIHENSGFTLLLLVLFRLYWRATHPAPPLPAGLSPLLRLAAHANHAVLYALLVALPLVGVAATAAWGFPFRYLGLIPIPSPFGKDEALAPTLSAIHDNGAFVLLAAIAVHIAAALWHQWVRKDGTLDKML